MRSRRDTHWQALADDPRFDVIVVGGGVNGIGVYRDLALQGLRVLLVERADFSSGCSAAPSRMIHGGLRYLENGEVGLVRESLRERDALLRNAPHMVRPLPTLIPITSLASGTLNALARFLGRDGPPAARGAVPIKAGLVIYDLLTLRGRRLPPHRFLGGRTTRRTWPALTPAARWSAVYHDAWITHPERLCIEMLTDVAAAAPAAVALNYARLSRDGDGYAVEDLRGGARCAVRTRLVIHATGAWLDQSVGDLATAPGERMVAGTKGSHLIIDNPTLLAALAGHMVYFENVDGRVCIAFPYLGRVLAGSTDIRVDVVDRPRCEDPERDYILESLRLVFPDIAVRPDEILFSFAGVRPLPMSSARFTGAISRGHFLRRIDGPVPQVCMIGGKWTTFRAFAEQTADLVLADLGLPRRVSTLDLPIGAGGAPGPGEAPALEPGDDAPLAGTTVTRGQVRHMLREEWAETLADLVLRRTTLAIRGDLSLDLVDALGAILAAERGLAPAALRAETDRLLAELETDHGVTGAMLASRNRPGDPSCA